MTEQLAAPGDQPGAVDGQVEAEQPAEEGELVACHWRWTGRCLGANPGSGRGLAAPPVGYPEHSTSSIQRSSEPRVCDSISTVTAVASAGRPSSARNGPLGARP